MGRTAGEIPRCEGGKTGEIVLGEEERVEPVDTALVTEVVS